MITLFSFCRRRFVYRPTDFSQRDRLSDQPTPRPHRWIIFAPLFRFVDRLTIELKNELGMTGGQNVGLDILMTGDAGIRAHVKASQIMHPGADSRGISPVGSRVSAQPRFSRAVTIFARHSFIRSRARRETSRLDRLERRMANRATCARLRLRNANRLADSRRTRIEQNRERAGVKILLRPGDVLAAFFARAAVTAGRLTTN